MLLENCFYKKSVLLFLSTGATQFLIQSTQRTVFNEIRFLLSSLITNMETILNNFQQKFALVKEFSPFCR